MNCPECKRPLPTKPHAIEEVVAYQQHVLEIAQQLGTPERPQYEISPGLGLYDVL